ncbi:MAG: sn-glycerol-1-phosphate dehydrogenase, partial [Clostridia bacterium]|nr:sn-glycerol-1-phosphate dehydrogenase [Clostridia bacterium]
MTLSELINPAGIPCSCGKPHSCTIDRIICRPGAIDEIPSVVRSYTDKKIFVLCDPNTSAVA